MQVKARTQHTPHIHYKAQRKGETLQTHAPLAVRPSIIFLFLSKTYCGLCNPRQGGPFLACACVVITVSMHVHAVPADAQRGL